MYLQQINNEIFKIENLAAPVDIERIRNICKKAGIDFPNTGERLWPEQILQKLENEEGILDIKIKYVENIVHRLHELLLHVAIKKPIQAWQDTRDTQSMRNVIGISIAVCAIVTLCIVLLIAVRNKHRANAEVRLLKWI